VSRRSPEHDAVHDDALARLRRGLEVPEGVEELAGFMRDFSERAG
jgi:hypothetical protein